MSSDRTSADSVAVRALWLESQGRVALRDECLAAAGPAAGQVRVRAWFSAISRGTEALVFNAAVPRSEYQRMRAPHQVGEFPAPVKYGYSSVGVVAALGSGVDAGLYGATTFCLFPHQDSYDVDASALTPLPIGVPPERAVLAANMETAINALWDAPVRPGDRVCVFGAGVVGCLVAWLAARVAGTRVQLVDREPSRAAVAAALGCRFALPAQALGDNDLVFHASGAPAGLQQALPLCAFEAELIELSWYGDALVPAPLGGAFHSGRLTLRASQVGHVAGARRANRTHAQRLALALELLAEPSLDVLISEEIDFDSLPARMADICAGKGAPLAVRVRYPRGQVS